MALFRAIKKGYYGDVMHYPANVDHGPLREIFEAPDDFKYRSDADGKPILDSEGKPKDFCTWVVPVEGETLAAVQGEEVSGETLSAEAQLDAESEAAAPVEATPEAEVSDSDSDDIEGVETR